MHDFVGDFTRSAHNGIRSLIGRYLDGNTDAVPVAFPAEVLSAAVTNAVYALYHPDSGAARDLTLLRHEHGLDSGPRAMLLHLAQLGRRVVDAPPSENANTEGHIGAVLMAAIAANAGTMLALLSGAGVDVSEVTLDELVYGQLDIIESATAECC